MTPAEHAQRSEPGQLELCRCGHPFRSHDYGSVNWHCEAGDPGSFCKCDAFNNEAWEYTPPPTEPTTGAILAKIARLKDALAAAEQRAQAAEAELRIANSLLVLGKQREQHAEIVRLNQLIVDGDATIMTQGEEIEHLKAELDLRWEYAKTVPGLIIEAVAPFHEAIADRDAEIERLRAQVATLEAEVADLTKARRLAEYDRLRQRP